jgi:hypothetical protein
MSTLWMTEIYIFQIVYYTKNLNDTNQRTQWYSRQTHQRTWG